MSNVYLIKLSNEKESFYKIGVTVHKYCRFYEIMKSGYSVEIVYMAMKLEFYDAQNLESYLQRIYESYRPKIKFGGYTECFKHIDIENYKEKLNGFLKQNYSYIENLKITWR